MIVIVAPECGLYPRGDAKPCANSCANSRRGSRPRVPSRRHYGGDARRAREPVLLGRVPAQLGGTTSKNKGESYEIHAGGTRLPDSGLMHDTGRTHAAAA